MQRQARKKRKTSFPTVYLQQQILTSGITSFNLKHTVSTPASHAKCCCFFFLLAEYWNLFCLWKTQSLAFLLPSNGQESISSSKLTGWRTTIRCSLFNFLCRNLIFEAKCRNVNQEHLNVSSFFCHRTVSFGLVQGLWEPVDFSILPLVRGRIFKCINLWHTLLVSCSFWMLLARAP